MIAGIRSHEVEGARTGRRWPLSTKILYYLQKWHLGKWWTIRFADVEIWTLDIEVKNAGEIWMHLRFKRVTLKRIVCEKIWKLLDYLQCCPWSLNYLFSLYCSCIHPNFIIYFKIWRKGIYACYGWEIIHEIIGLL